MMGVQHALGGAALWLAAVPALDAATELAPEQVVLGAVLSAGAGMAPDFDKHNSTIGRTYGPLTNVVARLIAAVSGGHRNGTHSLLGLVVFTGLAWAAVTVGGWGRFVLLWVLLGVAVRAAGLWHHDRRRNRWYGLGGAIINGAGMGVVTMMVLSAGINLAVPLVAGMALGVASHIILDMLTPQRCPLLWPFSKRRHGVGLVTTGSPWSSPVVTFVLTTVFVFLAWTLT